MGRGVVVGGRVVVVVGRVVVVVLLPRGRAGHAGGVDAYVTWVFGLLDRYDSTFHLVANQLVDIAPGGDIALSESYGLAMHRGDDEDGRWPVPEHLRSGTRDDTDPVWTLVPDVTER